MKALFFIILIIVTISIHSITIPETFEEKKLSKTVEQVRKNGFSDIEIDNLHKNIGININKIDYLLSLDIMKNYNKYVSEEPEPVHWRTEQDKDNKRFIKIDLGMGESFASYPQTYLYYSNAYIYPGAEGKGLDKIILDFKRIQSKGTIFVREMRRLSNSSPKEITIDENGNKKIDDNSDILLEYFSGYDSKIIWPNNPILTIEPSIKTVLNDTKNPLPYSKQRKLLLTYKKYLRKIDEKVAKDLKSLELNQSKLLSKMSEFQ